jgi:hypothetical protein
LLACREMSPELDAPRVAGSFKNSPSEERWVRETSNQGCIFFYNPPPPWGGGKGSKGLRAREEAYQRRASKKSRKNGKAEGNFRG